MGHGTMTPETRYATARRLLRESEAALAETRGVLERMRASFREATEAFRERIASEETVAAHLSSERDAACGALADMIEASHPKPPQTDDSEE